MSRQAIFAASVEYFLRPLRHFLDDQTVTEILVNRFDQVYVERRGRLRKTDTRFASPDALLSAIHNVAQWVGREIGPERPVLDARLPDGSRVHAVLPPAARHGPYLTIRKFQPAALTLDELVRCGALSAAAREFLEICVRLHKNLLLSGGTGTGKTSLLSALARAIADDERIVVIEDTGELHLEQEHCVYLEVQPPDARGRGGLSLRQLFVASLRMRPDRILVGEVRGGEALDMVQALLSGHAGSLSTIHANSPRDCLVRLETLSLMSDVELPPAVARTQVAAAIDLVVQLARFSHDGSRRVTRISEAVGLDGNQQYLLRDLFVGRWDNTCPGGPALRLEPTGERPTFAEQPYQQGLEECVAQSRQLWTADNRPSG